MIPPCLTISNIRYVSRVKWSNPGKGVVPSPIPLCSSYWKGSLLVSPDYSRQLHIYMCVYIVILRERERESNNLLKCIFCNNSKIPFDNNSQICNISLSPLQITKGTSQNSTTPCFLKNDVSYIDYLSHKYIYIYIYIYIYRERERESEREPNQDR